MDFNKLLKHLSSKDTESVHLCRSPLMRGIPLEITPQHKLKCAEWKLKALQIEEKTRRRKEEEKKKLMVKCKEAEIRFEKNQQKDHNQSLDVNHNYYNTSSINSSETASYMQQKISNNGSSEKLQLTEDTQHVNPRTPVAFKVEKLQKKTPFAPEVEKRIIELVDLQKQQEELDEWHAEMQTELDLEKMKLAEKYDQLRLQNIKKQKNIIENSQEYLRSSINKCTPLATNTTPTKVLAFKTPAVFDVDTPQKLNDIGNEDSIDFDSKNNRKETTLEKNQSTFQFHSLSEKDYSNGSQSSENTCEGEAQDVFDSPLSTAPSKAFGSEVLLQHYRSMDAKLRRKSRATKFFHTPESKKKNALTNKLQASSQSRSFISHTEIQQDLEIEKETNHFSTPIASNVSRDISTHETFQGENSSSFCHTPNALQSSHQRSLIVGSHSCTKRTSTSTPHEVSTHNPYVSDLSMSQIYADEIPYFCDEGSPPGPSVPQDLVENFTHKEEKPVCQSRARLFAIYNGFIVRRLLKTNKVKDIIKTIKDTQLFLDDIDKENEQSGRRSQHLNLADRQLRARLLDELSTKHRKLIDIFLMSRMDQWKVIANNRLRQEEKQMKSTFKPPVVMDSRPKTGNKKLSAASQKSMKRRQDNIANKARPKTAPEKISATPVKKTSEARALKPIQSTSPTMMRRTNNNVLLSSLKKNQQQSSELKKKPARFSSAQI